MAVIQRKKNMLLIITGACLGLGIVAAVIVGFKGGPKQTVPQISGDSVHKAIQVLEESSYSYELIYAQSASPKGTVFKVDPAPGSEVKPGATIRLYVAIPITSGSKETPNTKSSSKTQVDSSGSQQKQTPNSSNGTGQQKTQGKTKAQIDAEKKAALDKIDAEIQAAQQAAQAEIDRLAAEQARRDALYNAMVAANNEVTAARNNLTQAQNSVNDFASRGMIQSGAGAQAIANLAAAQERLNVALVASQAANDAWAAR